MRSLPAPCLSGRLVDEASGEWVYWNTCAAPSDLPRLGLSRAATTGVKARLRASAAAHGQSGLSGRPERILGCKGILLLLPVFADVTLPHCEECKPNRKDAGGFWGARRGQVWDDYRVSIHLINPPVIFAQNFILISYGCQDCCSAHSSGCEGV